jgi:hypothetical protein
VFAQAKTVTFSTPTTQNVLTIPLVDNTPVAITATGNLTARCTPNTTGDQCTGIPTGGGGGSNPASATLTGSLNNGATDVTPNSPITLTPGSNGAVCLRRSTPQTLWGPAGSFGNPIYAPVDAADASTVNLTSGSTQYTFEMKCYGDGGSSETRTWSVTTGAGGGGTPANCNAINPPAGFTRSSTTSFSELRGSAGLPPGAFPRSGADFFGLGISRQQYVSIAFTLPTPMPSGLAQRFFWNSVNYVIGGYININNNYVTIRECPGDFRIAPPNQNAPIDDPTFSDSCTNFRSGAAFVNVNYSHYPAGPIQASTGGSGGLCKLQEGRTYYFNMVLDGPQDGAINTAGSANGCQNAASSECGFGLRYD